MSTPTVTGIIPARHGSTRLPGKPLKMIGSQSMIERVYARCLEAKLLDAVVVATDDTRIVEAVTAFGGKAVMTKADHVSGTDRLAEAASQVEGDIIVNIQGDQPFIDPVMIGEGVQPLLDDPTLEIATLMYPIARPEDLADPGVVKVVTDLRGNALYFSRSLIPYPREAIEHHVYEHVGLYVYRKDTLLTLAGLAPTPLENIEALEQLRWLQHGLRVHVRETRCADQAFSGLSVDTAEDLARAVALLKERGIA